MPTEQEVDAAFAELFGPAKPDTAGACDNVLRERLRQALARAEAARAPKAFQCADGVELRALHRDRAKAALARHVCNTRLTDGNCDPGGGACRWEHKHTAGCIAAAEDALRALEAMGCAVVWEHDPFLAITMERQP